MTFMALALALVLIPALLIILIIQIKTLGRVRNLAELIQNMQSKKSQGLLNRSSKKDRRANDSRKSKKQNSRTSSQTQKPVTSVDKSLRDINLRLKNAERDQEKARKNLNKNQISASQKKSNRDFAKKNGKRRNDSKYDSQKKSPSDSLKSDLMTNKSPSSSEKPGTIASVSKEQPLKQRGNEADLIKANTEQEGKIIVKRRFLSTQKEDISPEKAINNDNSDIQMENKISFGRR